MKPSRHNFLKYVSLFNMVLFLLFVSFSCKSPIAPPISKGNIALSLSDVSCTEAWLNVKVQSVSLPVMLTIKSGDQVLYTTNLSNSDSLIYIDSLLPNKNYALQGFYTTNPANGAGNVQQTTNKLTIQTMDTTSHNFTWTEYKFGSNAGSSNFNDVAIVSDTDIWAVGDININDTIYNAVHWDGNEWNLKRIPYYYQSSPTYSTIEWLFALSGNNIWFGNSVHLDGQDFYNVDIATSVFFGIGTNEMFINSMNELFVVGNQGTIAYSSDNGTSWSKAISGTTIDLRDIWGSADGKTVWACGYSNDYSQSCILKYDGSTWSTLWEKQSSQTPPYGFLVSTLWANSKYLYAGAADGIYRTALIGNSFTRKVLSLPSGPHRIRGSAENNIAVACDDESIWYFNGASWFKETQSALLKPLYSIAVSANTIVAVGFDATTINTQGIILVGKRN
ncbi:MAG: WD40/YVTN/BNR-like repeat-containing protein [Ignavibacteriaceae bacterium]